MTRHSPQDGPGRPEGTQRLYLSVAEVCEALGVSRGTLERGIRSGTVPHVRPGGPGGSIRIPRAWVCVGGCREKIAARAPWTVCKACGLARRHRKAA